MSLGARSSANSFKYTASSLREGRAADPSPRCRWSTHRRRDLAGISVLRRRCRIVPRLDCFDALVERVHQSALADASDDDPEESSLEVLSLSYHDVLDV